MKIIFILIFSFLLLTQCKILECEECKQLGKKDTFVKCYVEAHQTHFLRPGKLYYIEKDTTFSISTLTSYTSNPACFIDFKSLEIGKQIPISYFYYRYVSQDDYSLKLVGNTGFICFTKIDSINNIAEGNFESYIGDHYSEGKVTDGAFKVNF